MPFNKEAFYDQRAKDFQKWEDNKLDYMFLNAAGACEVKAVMLGRLATGNTVTLEEVHEAMIEECYTDSYDLCLRRAKAFMNCHCKGS